MNNQTEKKKKKTCTQCPLPADLTAQMRTTLGAIPIGLQYPECGVGLERGI